MNAFKTYQMLKEDILKSLDAICGVRTIEAIHDARKMPGYIYNQDKEMREYWIALGQHTVSAELSTLSVIINRTETIVRPYFQSRQDLVNFFNDFVNNKDKVIASLEAIIGNPSQIFIGYDEPITMEKFLSDIVNRIHADSLNLEYNLQELRKQ